MHNLTDNDRAVLAAIEAHYNTYYQPPTIRWLCDYTGINSTSHVRTIMRKLSALGKIQIIKRKPVPSVVVAMKMIGGY